MIVAVGSQNPVKLESARLAFTILWPNIMWEVIGCPIDSTVPVQPMSDEQARQGARTRARSAIEYMDSDYGVGLEGGLQEIEGCWFDSGWVVVLDKTGKEGIGSTIRMRVPPRLMRLVMDGKELGDACDQIFGLDNTKRGIGFFGLMTANMVNRTGTFRDAVLAALTPFLHPELLD